VWRCPRGGEGRREEVLDVEGGEGPQVCRRPRMAMRSPMHSRGVGPRLRRLSEGSPGVCQVVRLTPRLPTGQGRGLGLNTGA
jgi:hypothetical protein